MKTILPIMLVAVLSIGPVSAAPKTDVVKEASVESLQAAMRRGETSAEALTRASIKRIETFDKSRGLNSVIVLNPNAVAEAKALDAERKAGKIRGPLHGIPVLIKDNVETKDPIATTAGSLALKDNVTGRDAPVVARLRAAGAVILGKTNLSEWANIRDNDSMSGWSAVGGLTGNAYDARRSACGSSSGSGVAVAWSFAVLAVGTETDGSVVCPSAMNGIVGLKPSMGLISRTHVVPISHSQDIPGPMARSVKDVAVMLGVMAGSDPADSATAEADGHKLDYTARLSPDALKGVRIGVLRDRTGGPGKIEPVFNAALKSLEAAGAVLVDIPVSRIEGLGEAELTVLKTELKADLNAYLATTPATVKTRTLAEVIAFNTAHAATEMPFFGQAFFVDAETTKGLDDPAYKLAAAKARSVSQSHIDGLLKSYNVTLLVAPTYGLPWLSDEVNGDQFSGPSASQWPAMSGYPHLTVPMGYVQGLPLGLSFIGTQWSDEGLLRAGYAFEQQAKVRVPPKE
ncbi:amidase [Asticcacaulis sp. YBE204]|uniref:amidase n=1 Tax=Asticcacaulis sp. YBE204 TaxID=1282363 RepID=UPI0003C406CD|nr:amidase [Asticcacaulis sp. YBE204]ESQ80569.1 amidase [Asticcacaulis sp. YBE204]